MKVVTYMVLRLWFFGGHIVLRCFVSIAKAFQPLLTKVVVAYFDGTSYENLPSCSHAKPFIGSCWASCTAFSAFACSCSTPAWPAGLVDGFGAGADVSFGCLHGPLGNSVFLKIQKPSDCCVVPSFSKSIACKGDQLPRPWTCWQPWACPSAPQRN